jgi:hypothetical protein
LWRLRLGVIVCLLLAALMSLWSVHKSSLSPLALEPRAPEIAAANTHVIVDTPTSAMLDLRRDTYDLTGLRNRAVLLGNVIASSVVQERIARRLGVPIERLRVQPPLTPEQPAPTVGSENERRTGDILKSTDEYRLRVQSSRTVPMLDIYAQARTPEAAAALANGAVEELKRYLAEFATKQGTPDQEQIRLVVLGEARGVLINENVGWQVALLVFVLTFAASCGTLIFLNRVRQGWRLESAAGSAAGA